MTVLASILMLVGSLLTLIAAIGVVRFPDVLTRLHAATKAASVGIALVLLGAGAALGPGPLAFTALVALFQLLTAPVAAHALGRTTRKEDAPEPLSPGASLPWPARIAGLAVLWVVLWGAVTPANVLGGLAVGAVVTSLVARNGTERVRLRPLAALRFAAVFTVYIARSTVSVAAAALGPRRLVRPEIITVQLRQGSSAALVAAANAVSLTPGTLTLAIDPLRSELVVHLIRPDDPAVGAITTLHDLAAAALPTAAPPEEVANGTHR